MNCESSLPATTGISPVILPVTDTDKLISSMQNDVSERLRTQGEWDNDLRAVQDMVSFIKESYQNFSQGDQSIVDIAIGPFNNPPKHEAYTRMLQTFTTIRPTLGKPRVPPLELTAQELISILKRT